MRRMLVITASYAPLLNARAFRWTALAQHFAANGWEVDVVTMAHAGAPAGSTRLSGVQVHRVGGGVVDTLRGSARAKPSRLKAGVLGLGRRAWRSLYWPDGDCLWYWPARRAALDLLRERRHETIVGVSPTFTAVVAARAAHRASPDARLVLDLGDPFSPAADIAPNNLALYDGLNMRTERDCFQRARAVSVTTPQTAGRYAAAFPESAAKVRVIPPLFSIPAGQAGGRFFPEDGKLRLVYVGTLYQRLREPGFLLRLFEALRARNASYELHFFGDVHAFSPLLEDASRRLDGAVRVHGVVPRETVARAVDDADILVNIGNTTRDQLPSKVVEYAASGKPILNIARHAEDSSVSFLAAYPDKLNLHDRGAPPTPAEVDALAAFAAGLPRRLSPAAVDAWLAPYRLPRIAAQYEEILR
jgi:glycosyltransferase involved in cell wall biosynthesis